MKKISYKDAIREAFEEEFVRNQDLFVLGEDIVDQRTPAWGDIREKFPKQVINNLPLLEDMLVGIGLGMSVGGLKPVLALNYDTHATLAIDDIYRAGIWRYRMAENAGPGIVMRFAHDSFGGRGPEFSASLLSLLFHLPNIWIATPSTPYQAKGLLKSALRETRPIVFWEHKKLYGNMGLIPEEEYTLPFGSSSVPRKGKHITVISWGLMSRLAVQAAQFLKKEGIELEIIMLHTLNPMDMNTIYESTKKTGRVVIIEEDMLRGGVGAEIYARIAEKLPRCTIKRVAAENGALPGLYKYEKLALPNEEKIISACRDLMR